MAPADPLPFRPPLESWLARALGTPCEIALGLVERARAGQAARGPGVWLGVEDALAPGKQLRLWLEASLALQLVDLSLGADPEPVASGHPAAALDEAERGVLAYAAARACAALGGGLRLTQIDTTDAAAPAEVDRLCFPALVRLGGHAGAAAAYLESAVAERWLPAPQAIWVLAAEPGATADLSPGDVMLLETSGVQGWLRVEGCEGLLPVRREGRGVRGRHGAKPAPDALRLEVDAGPVSWTQIADIQNESSPALTLTPGGPRARLVATEGRTWAAELVRLDGRLGARITGAAIEA